MTKNNAPAAPVPADDDLTVAEAAVLLKCSTKTVRNWIASGHLKAYRQGPRAIRITRADVAALREVIPAGVGQ